MSAATDLLAQAVEDQSAKLEELRKMHRDTIDAGRRAQDAVDRQARHVQELKAAVATLKSQEHRYEVVEEDDQEPGGER